jgi:hypothetical protein
MQLNDKALLVQLNISCWTARKFDKRITDAVADQHNVTRAAGRYNKALLPMASKLDTVQNSAVAIRREYYAQTLPWNMDGTQLLPTSNYLAFMTTFRQHKAEWLHTVGEFVDEYPLLKANAQQALGPLYNDADYPSVQDIEKKFKIDLNVMPIPTTDFRVALAQGEVDAIKQDMQQRLEAAQAAAMREVWQRLYDKVAHYIDRLGNPDARFHSSLVENARELCGMLPRLNFTNDPQLAALCREVENKLTCYDAGDLRSDKALRQSVAAEAQSIADRMRAFMSEASNG